MTLDGFLSFLDSHGILYKVTNSSIVLHDCPYCGSTKDKVWFFKERRDESMPFYGQCMKCETKTTSYKYLSTLGIDHSALNQLHGSMGLNGKLSLSVLPSLNLTHKIEEIETEPDVEPVPVDVSAFVPLDSVPDHPASRYAIKRGWTPAQRDMILIDYFSSAVVFVAKYKNTVVGFQRRYITPLDPSRKTLSSLGFQRNKFVMEFPNNGDVCVCEGPFTALSAWHFGYYAVCTFGSNVGDGQLDLIANLAQSKNKNVAIAFDLDKAGRKGYSRIRYSMLSKDIEAYRIKPELGNDLNDSWQAGKGVVVIPASDEDITIPMLDLPFKEWQ